MTLKRIFYVEDEPDIQAVARLALAAQVGAIWRRRHGAMNKEIDP